MAEKAADYSSANGFESKTPFLIGVAGGTASGKVSMTPWPFKLDIYWFLFLKGCYISDPDLGRAKFGGIMSESWKRCEYIVIYLESIPNLSGCIPLYDVDNIT